MFQGENRAPLELWVKVIQGSASEVVMYELILQGKRLPRYLSEGRKLKTMPNYGQAEPES